MLEEIINRGNIRSVPDLGRKYDSIHNIEDSSYQMVSINGPGNKPPQKGGEDGRTRYKH